MKLITLLISAALALGSCTHEETTTQSDCIDKLLLRTGYKKYNGEKLKDCTDVYGMYIYKGTQLFSYNNNCADVALTYLDCDGNDVTDTYINKDVEFKGIVAFQ